MRIKKDGKGGYIDRDSGRVLSPAEWGPIIDKASKAGSQGASKRWKGETQPAGKTGKARAPARAAQPEKEYKPQLKKVGNDRYIDRRTGRELERSEWMPRVSAARAYGQISGNRRNIKQSLNTIQENYGLSKAEVKARYVRFVQACERYGKDKHGNYKADFGEYMYEGKT